VAKISLDTSPRKAIPRRPLSHYRRSKRSYFDRVAKGGTCAMRLDERELICLESGIRDRCTQHAFLRLAVRRCKARRASILPDSTARRRHSQFGTSAKKHGTAALAPSETVGTAVERVALACERWHPCSRQR